MKTEAIETISVDLLPAIVKIIEDAQSNIRTATGLNVRLVLKILNTEEVGYKEMLWLSLQQALSSKANVKWSNISSKERSGDLPFLRQMYCYAGSKIIGGKSLREIGSDVCYKDHSSVLYAIDMIGNAITIPNHQWHDKANELYNHLKTCFNN